MRGWECNPGMGTRPMFGLGMEPKPMLGLGMEPKATLMWERGLTLEKCLEAISERMP